MTLKIWQSYSCNNSSSFRLVARFSEPLIAAETAIELREFLAEHAKQVDTAMETGDMPEGALPADAELATKYGFAWDELLFWGDDLQTGDEPSVAAEHDVLVVYHTYCNGFGSGIRNYLRARGGTVTAEDMSDAPTLSVLFEHTGSATLDEELAMMMAQTDTGNHALKTPWPGRWECYGQTSFFRDVGTVGMYFPVAPIDIPAVRAWLDGHGVKQSSIRLCEDADEKRFQAIAKARCTACSGPLQYLDPRIHDIERPQLVCKPCGGLYDPETFGVSR